MVGLVFDTSGGVVHAVRGVAAGNQECQDTGVHPVHCPAGSEYGQWVWFLRKVCDWYPDTRVVYPVHCTTLGRLWAVRVATVTDIFSDTRLHSFVNYPAGGYIRRYRFMVSVGT